MKAQFQALAFALLLTGCVTNVSGYRVPGVNMSELQTLVLVPKADSEEGRQLEGLVADEFRRRGFAVLNARPENGGEGLAIVEYSAAWQWDITTYLLELRVALYETDSPLLIAQAQSHQSSLARRPVEEIVARTVAELLGETGDL